MKLQLKVKTGKARANHRPSTSTGASLTQARRTPSHTDSDRNPHETARTSSQAINPSNPVPSTIGDKSDEREFGDDDDHCHDTDEDPPVDGDEHSFDSAKTKKRRFLEMQQSSVDSSAVLRELVLHGNEKVMKEVRSLDSKVSSSNESLQKQIDVLHEAVKINNELLQSIFYSVNSKNKKNSDGEKEKKIDIELVLLDDIFNDSVVERILEVGTICHMSSLLSRVSGKDLTSMSSTALRIIMYSKPVKGQLSVFNNGIGKEHSTYRESVVKTLVDSVRKDKFNQFSESGAKSLSANSLSLYTDDKKNSKARCKPLRPKWLGAEYISDEHIIFARNKREELKSEANGGNSAHSKERKGTLNRNDIAREAVDRVYKKVINRMKIGRESAKNSFFQEAGYLFVLWSDLLTSNIQAKVDQESIDIQWFSEPSSLARNVQDIPTTKAVSRLNLSYLAADDDPFPGHKENMKTFSKFISENLDMLLIVSHDVVVKRSHGTKTVQEKRKLKRTVNMLDVAARLLSNFVCLRAPNSPMSILSCFPDSMRVIYSVACLLRGFIEKMMEALEESGGHTLHRNVEDRLDDDEQEEYMPVRFESISIADLLPSKTRQTKTITKCLVLTEGEFESMDEKRQNDEEYDDDEIESGVGNDSSLRSSEKSMAPLFPI